MQQPAPVGRPVEHRVPAQHAPLQAQPSRDQQGTDAWLELELIADRLARLVLHAHALAERMLATAAPTPHRDDRVRRLREAAELARRALDALVGPSGGSMGR